MRGCGGGGGVAGSISFFTMAWRRYFFAFVLFINPFMLRICTRKYRLETVMCNIVMTMSYWTK